MKRSREGRRQPNKTLANRLRPYLQDFMYPTQVLEWLPGFDDIVSCAARLDGKVADATALHSVALYPRLATNTVNETIDVGSLNVSRNGGGSWRNALQVRIVKMRNRGVDIDRRTLRDTTGTCGELAITDTTDQGVHMLTKVARLSQGGLVRAELWEVQIVWVVEGRMTLTGYEQSKNDAGQVVKFSQSWLITLDTSPPPRNQEHKVR